MLPVLVIGPPHGACVCRLWAVALSGLAALISDYNALEVRWHDNALYSLYLFISLLLLLICWTSQLLITMPSLGVYYFLSLTLSDCPSVCHKYCFFFFVSWWNRAIFGMSFFHVTLYKTLFLDFWFRPPTPKIWTKSPISRLVWQSDRRCLGLPGGFRGWLIQWNHAKCCGPTLVAMAKKFWLGAEIQSPTGLSVVILG